MVYRTILFLTAVLMIWSGGLGRLRNDNHKAAASQSDPMAQALANGVDRIDNANTPDLQRRDPRYEIANSDTLDLQFQYTPEFNQTVTVQPDGFITLREIGDVHVQGDTLPQVRNKVQTAYAKILAKPVVSIDLKDFNRPYFMALGQVARPGKYELRGVTTVSEAVAMAGGFNSFAKHSQVLVFRRVNDQWSSVTKLDLKHMLKSRNLSEDLTLHPGDMVYVPQNTISKVKSYVPNPTMGMNEAVP